MSGKSRQTLSYLRGLFEDRGIRPRNKLGQNFLIDLNLLELLVRTADLTADDLALEVGGGTGSLTLRLVEFAGAVLTVEIDDAFATLVEETLAERYHTPLSLDNPPPSADPLVGPPPNLWGPVAKAENVRVLHGDVLARKNELNPDVLAALDGLARQSGTCRLKLVANLPYAVAVPVITNLLLTDLAIECMAVTVQWEIAERLAAAVGTREYGALAVLVQSVAEVRVVRRLPPSAFWPRPQVDSAIVLIRPDPARRGRVTAAAGGVIRFRNFLRDLYVHRRKNLRGALVSLPSRQREKAEVDALLAELDLLGTARAETLDPDAHLRLCAAFG